MGKIAHVLSWFSDKPNGDFAHPTEVSPLVGINHKIARPALGARTC
jgi:hypothetical protein